MKGKRLTVILLVTALLLSASACCRQQVQAEQIVQSAIGARPGINTYQFDMDMTISSGTLPAATMNMNGVVDIGNRKMHVEMQTIGEIYIMGGWVYTNREMPDTPPETADWVKFEMPEGYWEEQDIAGQQLDLLADFADVQFTGTETVDGIECHKLRVTPDMRKLWAWFQMTEGMEELDPSLDPADLVSDFSVLLWIAKDTDFIMKSIVDMTMNVGILAMEMTATMVVHHVNEPVNIELSTEAVAATEMSVSPG